MSGKAFRWPPEKRPDVESAIRASTTGAEAAKRLGVTVASFYHACRSYGIEYGPLLGRGEQPEITPPTPSGLTKEELVEERKRRFSRLDAHIESRTLIPVRLSKADPIGILHFGDPHVDDEGTDIGLLERHARLVRETPGLYGATVGDTTNNWIGRLARLYSQQSTTQADAWQLAEWFVEQVRDWLYIVGGNHDAWSGSGDPMRWITGQIGALYQDSEVRIAIRFPGKREVRINCRHDFAGRSQWNAAHGPMKALMLGVRDHLAIAGHTHESAYGLWKDPQAGITCHAVKVASYKRHDRFALEKGFRDQHLGPACVTVIDPRLPDDHPDLIKVFWCPFEGAEFLKWLRSRERSTA